MEPLNLLVYINRNCSCYKITKPSDDIDEWHWLQARQLAVMPDDTKTAKNYLVLFGLTTLLEQLSKKKVEKSTKNKLSSLTQLILLLAIRVFSDTGGAVNHNRMRNLPNFAST
ncbi:hypothetical protein Aduo_011366 [Ancylostoma duodenale]